MTQSIFSAAAPAADRSTPGIDGTPQREEPSWLAAVGAGIDNQLKSTGAWIDNLSSRVLSDADRRALAAGWSYADHWETAEKGLSWPQVEYVRENGIHGPEALQIALAEAKRREELGGFWAAAGTAKAVVGSLAGEFYNPFNYAVGIGVHTAMARSALGVGRLVQQGRAGAAVGAAVGEAAVGELLITGLQDATGEVYGYGDYLTSAAFGAVFGLGFSRGTYRAAVEQALINDAKALARKANPPDQLDPATADPAKVDAATTAVDTASRVVKDDVIPEDLRNLIKDDYDGKAPDTPAPKPSPAPSPEVEEVGPATPPPPPKPTPAPGPEKVEIDGGEVVDVVDVPDVTEVSLDPANILRIADDLVAAGDPAGAWRLLDDVIRDGGLDAADPGLADMMKRRASLFDDVPATQRDPAGADAADLPSGRIRAVRTGVDELLLFYRRRGASGRAGDPAAIDTADIRASKAAATKAGGTHREVDGLTLITAATKSANPAMQRLRPLLDTLLRQPDTLKSTSGVLVQNAKQRGYAGATGRMVAATRDPYGGAVSPKGDLATVFDAMSPHAAETVVHEMVHLFTNHLVDAASNATSRAKLSAPVLEAIETLEDILKRLNEHLNETGVGTAETIPSRYAAKNLHELLAMGMTNVETMMTLAKLPASKKWGGRYGNAMQEFLYAVRQMLGLTERTAQDDLVDAFSVLFRAHDTVALRNSNGTGFEAGWPGRVQQEPPLSRSQWDKSRPLWDNVSWIASRNVETMNNPANDKVVADITLGRLRTVRDLRAQAPGVYVWGDLRLKPDLKATADSLRKLAEKWLPDEAVIFSDALPTSSGDGVQGTMLTIGKAHVIGLRPTLTPARMIRTGVHEVGHAVFHKYARTIPADLLADMRGSFEEFVTDVFNGDPDAVNRRWSLTSINREKLAGKAIKSNEYNLTFDEYAAEQFVKYIEQRAQRRGAKAAGLTAHAVAAIKDLFNTMLAFFKGTVNDGHLAPDASFEQFFDGILQREELRAGEQIIAAQQAPTGASVNPVATISTRRKFADRMYEHARAFVARRPVDVQRLRSITAKLGGLSDGLILARSNNPILQMVASLVTETTTGAAGRGATAAIRKEMLTARMTGNGILDYEAAYSAWKATNKVGVLDDLLKGDARVRFNRAVNVEILNRRAGADVRPDPAVARAADALEKVFERALKEQKQAGVLGADRLPDNSRGYVPQALDGRKLANATADEVAELTEYLEERFRSVLGWSAKFSKEFSDFYVMRARARTMNVKAKDFSGASNDPLTVIRDSLTDMGNTHPDPNIRAEAAASVRGMGHTKRRLDIDLRDTLPSGKLVMDFYEDDPLFLMRRYVNRVSGTVALTEAGIPGDVGVRNLADVLDFPTNPAEKVTQEEREAFDRVMAEMLGQPVPGEVVMQHLTTLRLLTSMQRLGGLAWTQAAETVNMVHQLGLAHTLRGVASLPRMLGEVGRVKRGADPMNHLLTSLETLGGEFGSASYKLNTPLDPPDNRVVEYSNDAGLIERLARAGTYAQAKVSGFRALMSAQHRMVAEQIVLKSLRYIRAGGQADKWLADMGLDEELVGHLRTNLHRIAQFDRQGNVVSLDITRLPDYRAAEQYVQAIHRGVHQIIQGTYVGERGKWAHNDLVKLLLQLRTFGLTAAEKQWTRTAQVHGGGASGYSAAAFTLVAQMALVTPLIAARVHAASVGREDREEYIRQQLSPVALMRAAMNYTALSGLMGDFLDASMSVAGGLSDDAKEALGGRQGTGSPTVSGVVPALGSVEAAAKVATGNAAVYYAMKQLPFSNLPYVVPFINLFKEE